MLPDWAVTCGYHAAKWIGRASILAMIVVGVLGILPDVAQEYLPFAKSAQKWLAANSKWLATILPLITAACGGITKWMGEPWFWKAAQRILDKLQDEIFSELAGAFADDHRITLYQFRKYCFFTGWRGRLWPWGKGNHPWSGWMVPILKAGGTGKGKTVFLARSSRFEGVAGATFRSQSGALDISNLPDIHANQSESAFLEYQQKTFVSEELLRERIARNRPCARSYRSTCIEVKSKRWGVLMIDSRAAAIPKPNNAIQKFATVAFVLTILLEKRA